MLWSVSQQNVPNTIDCMVVFLDPRLVRMAGLKVQANGKQIVHLYSEGGVVNIGCTDGGTGDKIYTYIYVFTHTDPTVQFKS